MFYEVSIQACPSGFGEFQCQPINGEGWADVNELLTEITSNNDHVFELTDEVVDSALPGQADDIRGRIHNEPDRVFAIVDGDRVFYFGIVEK
jgi:hypothetical protein